MAPVVRISDANWERLKRWAIPLEDSADDALGKVLDAAESQSPRYQIFEASHLIDNEDGSIQAASGELVDSTQDGGRGFGDAAKSQRGRRRKGLKVPQDEYELPILESLSKLGGKARASDVLDELEQRMKPLFSPVDYEFPKTGTEARWRNTARWARAALIQQGLIKAHSERGVWELTQRGVAEARSRKQ